MLLQAFFYRKFHKKSGLTHILTELFLFYHCKKFQKTDNYKKKSDKDI